MCVRVCDEFEFFGRLEVTGLCIVRKELDVRVGISSEVVR